MQHAAGVYPPLARAATVSDVRQVVNDGAEYNDDLTWSGKCLGGLQRDLSRKLAGYRSDWVDAFVGGNFQKTTASICFLYFACLSPALAFGNSYMERLGGEMGVMEAILSTAFSGMIFAVLAGQPLNIIGATGPKFAFIASFYDMCESMDLDFLVARVWLGLWCAAFLVVLSIFEASCLMKWATRFMEDIFSLYIGLIFVVQALQSIFGYFDKGRDAGFLTILLGLGTCYLIIQLKAIRNMRILNLSARGIISNFAVALTIVLVAAFSRVRDIQDTNISYLEVPSDLSPTRDRSWFISPFGNEGLNAFGEKRGFPLWAMAFMALPGMGFALLNFMDQNTTALLVNRRSNGIKKPVGYHLDMLVLAIIYVPCALFGVIFPAGSTVPALTHVISLTTYEDRPILGGGTQKVALKVVEQRWTGFMIHALIFLSLFAAPVLEKVPKAVLYGVFLFMGLSSRQGNQMYERLTLWLNLEPSTYPRLPYVTRTKTRRMHLYTLIQVVLLGCVYGLTSIKQTGVLFPFFVAGLVPFRVFVLPLIFTDEELEVLDARDDLPPDVPDDDESKASDKGFERQASDKGFGRQMSAESVRSFHDSAYAREHIQRQLSVQSVKSFHDSAYVREDVAGNKGDVLESAAKIFI